MFVSLGNMKKNVLISSLFFLLFLSLWEVFSQIFIEFRFVLPPPSAVILKIVNQSDLFIKHSQVTIREMAGGFIIAFLVAFPLAWVMYMWKSSCLFLDPLFVILQSLPMFTLAPLMVLWFGWSYTAIVIPTALMIFLPLTLNTYQALASTPADLLNLFKINKASYWQTFVKLQLPWSIPYLFAGIRISAAFAGIGAIAGEWAGAQSGLGVLMMESRRSTDLVTTFAALVCLILISLILYSLISYLEYRWKKHQSMEWATTACFSLLVALIFFINPVKNTLPSISETRLLLDWFPNSNHVPIFVGKEKGIFAKHGIHLQILQLNDPSDTIPYLTSGLADLALFYMPDVARLKAQGEKLAVAGVLINQPLNSFIYLSDKEIKSPSDLSDKVIGYSVSGNKELLLWLLEQANVSPKELRNVSFDLVSTLAMGHVDAIYGAFWNIETEHLRSLGIKTEHFDVAQFGHPSYSELVFISKENQSPQFFKIAIQESIDFSRQNPVEAFELYARANPSKSEQTLAWEKEAWLKTIPVLALEQEIKQSEWNSLTRVY